MNPEQHERVQRLFGEARTLPPNERTTFLTGLDSELRSEVESLLAYDVSDERIPLHEDRIVPPMLSEVLDNSVVPELPSALGHYRIIRALGQGGMGAVYLAEDEELGRQVALKVIRPERLFFPGAVERFRREARAASRLEHPNICPIYDVGEDAGVQYMAMRLVHGETLAEKIHRARSRSGNGRETSTSGIPIPEVVNPLEHPTTTTGKSSGRKSVMSVVALFEKVARALHVAHEAGLVHRDIKPGNIMVAADGEPVILDFGLALDLERDDQSLTLSGDCVGTPLFMSPEQVEPQGMKIDRRTDVYSLAVACYEALTLKSPFESPTRDETYQRILREDPPLAHKVNREVPKDLGVVLATAMDKGRERRYATALDFAEDLKRVREFRPVLARPISLPGQIARWTKRNTAAAVTFLLVTLGLAVGLAVALVALRARDDALLVADRHVAFSLVQEEDQLWPRRREKLTEMDAWIMQTRDLLLRSSRHEAQLARLVGREREKQLELLGHLERLEKLIVDVEKRRKYAQTIERRSVHQHRTLWEKCIADIAEHPAYGGLPLTPQVGLVPLGKDRESDLWEFWHMGSGAKPQWEGDISRGSVRMSGDTGLVFVLLPGDSFWMGAQKENPNDRNYDEKARLDEHPPHEVRLSPFFLSKFEMTMGQWERVTGSDPSFFPVGSQTHRGRKEERVTLLHPVNMISRNDCEVAARRLDLRLPTEAQWEYAARGGTEKPWWFACNLVKSKQTMNKMPRHGNVADQTHGLGDSAQPHDEDLNDGHAIHARADIFEPNPFGIVGTVGNVMEWCADRYTESYKRVSARPGDGQRDDERSRFAVLRGAGFSDKSENSRVSRRWPTAAAAVVYDGGVRFALDVKP